MSVVQTDSYTCDICGLKRIGFNGNIHMSAKWLGGSCIGILRKDVTTPQDLPTDGAPANSRTLSDIVERLLEREQWLDQHVTLPRYPSYAKLAEEIQSGDLWKYDYSEHA